MRSKYYKIPFVIENLFSKTEQKPRLYTSLKSSLHQNLKLLFMTSFGDLRFDHDYGSVISELDFSNEEQSGLFEKKIETSLYETITKFEPRLKNINLRVYFNRNGEIIKTERSTTFKIFIHIEVKAIINGIEEKYEDAFKLYFSPLNS